MTARHRRRAHGLRHARGPEEIEPYYTDIRRGRPPTPEQLADLVRRYEAIGGVSPLAERTEAPARRRSRPRSTPAGRAASTVGLGLKHADADASRTASPRWRRPGCGDVVGARPGPPLLGPVGRAVPGAGRRGRGRRRPPRPRRAQLAPRAGVPRLPGRRRHAPSSASLPAGTTVAVHAPTASPSGSWPRAIRTPTSCAPTAAAVAAEAGLARGTAGGWRGSRPAGHPSRGSVRTSSP